MLAGATKIIELYDNDEFTPFLIQGNHGYGKSSYAARLLAEVGSLRNNGKSYWNLKYFEDHLGYDPDEVIKEWKKLPRGYKDYCYHWDDSGNWLHSLDFQDPFVKAIGKYMQVARSDWGCLIFSMINTSDISSRIRNVKDAIIIDISKHGCDIKHPHRRTASAYILRKSWNGREWKDYQWREYFNSHVPGHYNPDSPEFVNRPTREQRESGNVTWGFYGWYKPKRDYYTEVAKDRAAVRWSLRPEKDR